MGIGALGHTDSTDHSLEAPLRNEARKESSAIFLTLIQEVDQRTKKTLGRLAGNTSEIQGRALGEPQEAGWQLLSPLFVLIP